MKQKIKQILKFNKKAQAILEYAGFIGLIALAFLAFSMKGYLKHSIAHKMKQDITHTFGSEQYYGPNTQETFVQAIDEDVTVTGNNIP